MNTAPLTRRWAALALCLFATGISAPVPPASATPARTFALLYITNDEKNCLSIDTPRPAAGDLVIAAECNKTAPQRWSLQEVVSGGFRIVHRSGLCAEAVVATQQIVRVKAAICGLGPHGTQFWHHLADKRIRNQKQSRDPIFAGRGNPVEADMGNSGPADDNTWEFSPIPPTS